MNKKISFYKLMGSGKDGSFSKSPDWRQWCILTVSEKNEGFENIITGFIKYYFSFFNCKHKTFWLKPVYSKGTWDGKECFGNFNAKPEKMIGQIAVLTRATIRMSKLKQFWKHVPIVNEKIKYADGLEESFGVGEVPFIKQATFSIWKNEDMMKAFAYKQSEHKDVIVKTRKQDWYSEEMFTRFIVMNVESN